jgi:hypothetical protein
MCKLIIRFPHRPSVFVSRSRIIRLFGRFLLFSISSFFGFFFFFRYDIYLMLTCRPIAIGHSILRPLKTKKKKIFLLACADIILIYKE